MVLNFHFQKGRVLVSTYIFILLLLLKTEKIVNYAEDQLVGCFGLKCGVIGNVRSLFVFLLPFYFFIFWCSERADNFNKRKWWISGTLIFSEFGKWDEIDFVPEFGGAKLFPFHQCLSLLITWVYLSIESFGIFWCVWMVLL